MKQMMIFMLSELWSLQNPFVFHSSTLTLLPLYLSICWVMRTSMSMIVLMWFWAWIIRRYYECVFLFSEKGYCKNFMFEFLYFHQFFSYENQIPLFFRIKWQSGRKWTHLFQICYQIDFPIPQQKNIFYLI